MPLLIERCDGIERDAWVCGLAATINVADDSLLINHKRHPLCHTEEAQNAV